MSYFKNLFDLNLKFETLQFNQNIFQVVIFPKISMLCNRAPKEKSLIERNSNKNNYCFYSFYSFSIEAIFVCDHRPKTEELLELLFLLFSIWLISSFKGIYEKKSSPELGFKPGTSRSTVWPSTN